MMHCLLCDDLFMEPVSWFSFFMRQEQKKICPRCEQQFAYITGKLCGDCGRPLENISTVYKQDDVCYDCIRWRNQPLFPSVKNRSVYMYNDWMKEVLARFKFRGDAVLASLFTAPLRDAYETHFSHCQVIPIPLSKEREQERGFNQAELLAECLRVPVKKTSLMRQETEKQSKKTREERLALSCPFYFAEEENMIGDSILLVDDVYTTGITVRQAAKCFYEKGVKEVAALTLCRG